jgi:two-component system chemotaxis response regulator CheB
MKKTHSPPAPQASRPATLVSAPAKFVFVGASTGGTEAIKVFLAGLPAGFPPVLITQHMPEAFTGSFARRLDGLCALDVVEAADAMPVKSGCAYIAPGHSHMRVRRAGAGFVTELDKSPPYNRHRPSVDILFNSAAEVVGPRAVGVLLTGMGKDGALGLKAMHDAGAWTIAQDQASCVVFGMPREAIALGAADEVLALGAIAPRLVSLLR